MKLTGILIYARGYAIKQFMADISNAYKSAYNMSPLIPKHNFITACEPFLNTDISSLIEAVTLIFFMVGNFRQSLGKHGNFNHGLIC